MDRLASRRALTKCASRQPIETLLRLQCICASCRCGMLTQLSAPAAIRSHDSLPPLPQGPPDSPYAGGEFELVIAVPEQYPLVPPAGVYCEVHTLTMDWMVWRLRCATARDGAAGQQGCWRMAAFFPCNQTPFPPCRCQLQCGSGPRSSTPTSTGRWAGHAAARFEVLNLLLCLPRVSSLPSACAIIFVLSENLPGKSLTPACSPYQ